MAPLSRNTVVPRATDRPRYIEIDDEDNVRSTLNLEPDPSFIPPPSLAVTRIRRNSRHTGNSQRKLRNSRHSSADESPVAGPSRLHTLATPASGTTETSERVFNQLAGGKGVTLAELEEEWVTEVCGNCGLHFLRKALREHIQICAG